MSARLSFEDLPAQTWMAEGICSQADPDAFHPEAGPDMYRTTAKAKAICRQCPVAAPCLEFALDNNEQGIWGNTTARDRQRLRKATA